MIKTICNRFVSAFLSYRKALAVVLVTLTVILSFPIQFVKAVSIIDGEDNYTVYTFEQDTDDILAASSIGVGESDKVEVLNNSNSADGITIKINRAFPVTLKIGNETRTIETASTTIGELLSREKVMVDEYDKLNYSLDTVLTEGMVIKYTDINYEITSKETVLKYKTKYIKTPELKVGEKELITKGENGYESATYERKIVNGKVVSSKTIEKTKVKPTTQVVKVGAKIKKANPKKWMSDLTPKNEIVLDENGIPLEYTDVIRGTASAYCTGTTCSTGVKVKQGYIAVDPNIIPYGTKMYIRSSDGNWLYGYAVAADTGGFTSWGNTIADLYMYSYSDCVAFGRRGIEIYILP